jgi:hypothetical protein
MELPAADAGGELSRWATAGGTAATPLATAAVVSAVELALEDDRPVDAGARAPGRGADEPQATSSTASTAAAPSAAVRRPRITA